MTTDNQPNDVSDNALSLARSADRCLRVPGIYVITVRVDTPRRRGWDYDISRVEKIEVGRGGRSS